MISADLPVFTLSALHDRRSRTDLRRCLSALGVFYLRDHGIPDSMHEAVSTVTMAFFAQPDDAGKEQMVPLDRSIRRGYSRLEGESTAKVTSTGLYSDYSMCYSMGTQDNLFPSPEFKAIWTEYFGRMNRIAREVAGTLLVASSDLPEGGVEPLGDCEPVLRFRYFPDVPAERCAESEPLRMAPHYDLSILTLIHQTPCQSGFVSLQSETDDGYVDLPPMDGAIIVMCGAVGTLMADGRIRAPRHRVAAPPLAQRIGSNRTSSVFFLRPSSDFEFSVPFAKACGFEPDVSGATATFRQWISGNYVNMHHGQAPVS